MSSSNIVDSADFAILGAGAIGSILGAHLAHAGHRVVLLVRERRAEQIRAQGLRVKGLVDLNVQVPALTNASGLKHIGTLIVGMKTLGTAEALQPLRQVPIDNVFSIQNGAFKNDTLVEAFGAERVLGSLADTSGELQPDGSVLFTRNVNLLIGELTGGLSDRSRRLAKAIDEAGVRSTPVPDIVTREWSKFVGWAGSMTMAVATRVVTWKFMTDPDAALIVARTVREMGALARARGVALSDESILPVESMCRGSEADAAAAVMRMNANLKNVAPLHRVSSLQDFDAGRPLELEETIGHALREAQRLDIAMPVLQTLYHLDRSLERIRDKY
ncbi:MAG: ketopantoate reductase family protein [Povalibacter sp.]